MTHASPVTDPAARAGGLPSRAVLAARAGNGLPDGPSEIVSMIAELVPGETAESTARRIAERMLTEPGVLFASLAEFMPGDRVRSLCLLGSDGVEIADVRADRPFSVAGRSRVRRHRAHATRGPWVEAWSPGGPSPVGIALDRLGVTRLVMAPIDLAGQPVGFVQVGIGPATPAPAVDAFLPMLASFGKLASLLLAPQLDERARIDHRRAAIAALLRRKAFRTVFQPIVAMTSGRIVGYEALTRFADGTPPDELFTTATALGVGIELELATLGLAIAAAAELPRDAWLNLNVSPALLGETDRLAYQLWKAGSRALVLEITEHAAISDYAALRDRIDALGIPVRIAVDDAGAGFASMRHVLELKPSIIKLDRSLVACLDGDPVRQGLVVGLRHFAGAAGSTVVAEGIETEAERSTLVNLGVDLGQGYLLGRPSPATAWRPGRRDRRRSPMRPVGAPRPSGIDVVDRVGAILWEADGTDQRMTFVSEGAMALTGYPSSRWLMEPRFWEDHVHPEDRDATLRSIDVAIRTGQHVSLEYRFRLADGSYRWFQDIVEVLRSPGANTRLVGVMIDVTERRALQEQLAYRASHDALTGLLNRQGLQDELARLRSDPPAADLAVLFLDLDEFKVVNDTLGHEAGDEILRLVAARLRESVRAGDVVGRIGGDEFVVIAASDGPLAVRDLGERLVEIVGAPSMIADRWLPHRVSLGIAFVAPDSPADEVFARADLAMYAAKEAGGARATMYDGSMREVAMRRLAVASRSGTLAVEAPRPGPFTARPQRGRRPG